jgi:N-dimethylarginine dimethylaminohydrolase
MADAGPGAPPERVVAIVRRVPDSFASALLADGVDPSTVSVARARSQHAAYVAALRALPGVARVLVLPALHSLPDSVFVEDAAVLVRRAPPRLLVPGSAAPSRAAEAAATAAGLAAAGYDAEDAGGAALDGGDVLRVGDRAVFVGVSSRTDAAAIAAFADAAGPDVVVRAVAVPSSLHLKTLVTWVSTDGGGGGGTLPRGFLVAPDSAEGRAVVAGVLGACEELSARGEATCVCWVPAAESYAANVLQVGRVVLMPAGHAAAAAAVRRTLDAHGCAETAVLALEMGEFRKANGALTCLSIIV